MILAAGLGTRLLPLTEKIPKPLLSLAGQPVVDILIRRLQGAGCDAVIINTHHLSRMIEEFLETVQRSGLTQPAAPPLDPVVFRENAPHDLDTDRATVHFEPLQPFSAPPYSIPVTTRYEPTILGTGGAIKNVEDFWDDRPFIVINGDIFTNIDLEEVYRFHLKHDGPVTLVLHDCSQFNNVWVDGNDQVVGFGDTRAGLPAPDITAKRRLAFTGIHVLDPAVLNFIPGGGFCSIINAYIEMIRQGLNIKGFIARGHYWHDIGTMSGYDAAARDALARRVFMHFFPPAGSGRLSWSALKGDGSDRKWYRASVEWSGGSALDGLAGAMAEAASKEGRAEKRKGAGEPKWMSNGIVEISSSGAGPSVILVNHGAPPAEGRCEADSFFAIGRHLFHMGIPVPRILAYDRPTGSLVVEDLGDLNLQTIVRGSANARLAVDHYRAAIDQLVAMGIDGAKGFDPAMTYQTACYDVEFVLEMESKYFVEAFLNRYLGLEIDFQALRSEFEILAERGVEHPYKGLLHRDFQSRNILIRHNKCYFIDFQGARIGPLPYDLASLLIDPYVELPSSLRDELLGYYLNRFSEHAPVNVDEFLNAYRYCALNRNLQVLGAFGFLSKVKGKKDFEAYIPPAVASLKTLFDRTVQHDCPSLGRIIKRHL